MIYYKIKFSYGSPSLEGYQELNDEGTQEIRLTDLDGNTLIFTGPYSYDFVSLTPVVPSWAK
jgi:hypothetical protein